MNELIDSYSKLSDNELLIMVYFESSNYQEEAIKVAKSILKERGLSQPTSEILQQAKNYQIRTKESLENIMDTFDERKLKQAIRKKDYYFIGKWLFWIIIGSGIYSGVLGSKGNIVSVLLEVIFTIAVFGIIPVIFFFIYSLKLSPEQRKERGLCLFMPKYIFFMYAISLLIFVAFVILVVIFTLPNSR
ncbi:MAG: hypothetical protein SNJ71_03540 [Bacteroidales bacterium]